jgi:transposase-like protein
MRKRASGRWRRAIKEGKIWREPEARQALEACASSGESILVFSRRHGIIPERLYWWRRRLKRKSPRPRDEKVVTRAPLIPVMIRPTPPKTQVVDHVMVIAGKLRVKVANTSVVSPEWIAALLRLASDGGT